MRLLFDSHALIWFLLGDNRFPDRLRLQLERPETEFVISAVCIWEITAKVRSGRWPAANEVITTLVDLLRTTVYIPLPITIEHARTAGFLAWEHHDPFDRMLAAQSQAEGVPLVTADPAFRAFGTSVIW